MKLSTRANDGVTFTIESGEFAVILEPSGSPANHNVKRSGGMDKATSGEVIIAEKNISDDSDKELTTFRRNNIGFGSLPKL